MNYFANHVQPLETIPMRSYLLLSVIMAAALATAGCKDKKSDSGSPDGASPVRTGSGADGPKASSPKGSSGTPAFTMTPAEFRAEFARDGKGADRKFRGQVIELDGVVASIGQEPFDKKPGIFLKAEGTFTVFCATADGKPWDKVVPGAAVKLRGTLPGAISYQNPALADAQIIDAGGSKAQTLTASQLTTDYLADPNGTKAKYNMKAVGLEGEITEARIVAGDDMIVRLKGAQGTTVVVNIKKHGLEKAKSGQKLKVFGELNIPPAGAKELYLYASALIELK